MKSEARLIPRPKSRGRVRAVAKRKVRSGERASLVVVGLGASAGGLAAYRAFLEKMPPDSGLAFVAIQHLDPEHKSETASLLGRCTRMPVVVASNGLRIEPNHVYVIPPNAALAVRQGRLWLSAPTESRGRRLPIDFFFRSLAEEYQQRAIGIVLSGTGSDGTLGLAAIKVAGGLTLAQEPLTAEHDGMPRSAISGSAVDQTLPVERMPAELIKYARHPYVRSADGSSDGHEPADKFLTILNLLRARAKVDLGNYKQGTLRRRVHRRMSLRHLTRLNDYLAILRQDGDEVQALIKDLLISVTHFFRDPDAWKVLQEQVIRPLVKQKSTEEPIRVWVAGCATGEEAYSVAMLLLDEISAARKECPVQVFASDVNRDAITIARLGVFPESISADVAPQRLRRYFVREGDHYRIRAELRDAVVFAEHNLLVDPPFSKLDLITCRNLLIYLDAEAQKKILPLFHYALNGGGYLFLGSAENVGERHDLYRSISRKWRIYGRIGPHRPTNVSFPVETAHAAVRAAVAPIRSQLQTPPRFTEIAQQVILDRFAPACVVINRKHEILYTCGPIQEYLKQPSGMMQTDLLAWAHDLLRSRLRAALMKALDSDKPLTLPNLRIRRDRALREASITIEPLHSPRQAEGLILVTFRSEAREEAAVQAPHAKPATQSQVTDDSLVHQLEDELQTTRDDLKGTIDQLESANEELKASNEEATSVNEELQSSNEELETSKEELQSLNEELSTVNSQLQIKVDELETKNNDVSNLLSSTDIATLFLDRQFRVKWFTSPTTRLLRLIPTDIGRPISDFAQKFTGEDIISDADIVLHKLAPIEREVFGQDGRWYLRRIVPYRTADNRIDGVVIAFVDIHETKKGQEGLRQLAAVVRDSNDAVILSNLKGFILAWNHGAEKMYGAKPDDVLGRKITEFIPAPRRREMRQFVHRLLAGQAVAAMETQRQTRDGKIIDVSLTLSAVSDEGGRPACIASTERDITARKKDEIRLRESNQELERRVATRTEIVAEQALRLRELAAQLLETEEIERHNLASELHDNLAQVLHVAKMKLTEIRKTAPENRQHMLGEVEALISRANQSARNLSYQLSPPILHELGLVPALQWLGEEMEQNYKLKVRVDIRQNGLQIDERTRVMLFRAVRELLINVAKHAGVHRATVYIQHEKNHVNIIVEDHGVGFDPKLLSSSKTNRGFGLFSIRERLDYLGGKMEIQSKPGKKTSVTLTMPVVLQGQKGGTR